MASTIEIIISRYSFAIGMLKSASGHILQFREALVNKAKDRAGLLMKEIYERLQSATVRIYKLWASEKLILPGLKGRAGPAEFFPGFAHIMKR